MIRKLLFSLVCVLTLCITFVSTKVSASSVIPMGYELTPIELDQSIPYGTDLYYNSPTTNEYSFRIYDAINLSVPYTYHIYVYEGEWELTIYNENGEEVSITYYETQTFTLETIENGPSVEGDFVCIDLTTDSDAGQICLLTEKENEPNYIYSGVFELLANTLYGGTQNLTYTQYGLLEWFSILITISCLLLPFIIVFFVIKLLFK